MKLDVIQLNYFKFYNSEALNYRLIKKHHESIPHKTLRRILPSL